MIGDIYVPRTNKSKQREKEEKREAKVAKGECDGVLLPIQAFRSYACLLRSKSGDSVIKMQRTAS